MTPEEIQAMAKGLAQGQAVWYVLSACIGGGIAGLGAYLAEKGKNRATKEDIREITRTVKEVEAGFNEKLADLQAHHQLRMVAAERRMQAHQEAYTHWLKLFNVVVGEAVAPEYFEECRAWYTTNCIFLGIRSRTGFASSIVLAEVEYRARMECTQMIGDGSHEWRQMSEVGKTILEEVDLPALSVEAHKIMAKSVAPA